MYAENPEFRQRAVESGRRRTWRANSAHATRCADFLRASCGPLGWSNFDTASSAGLSTRSSSSPTQNRIELLGISFWDKREDAEQYHREQYPKVQETVRHLLEAEPVVRTFDVHTYVGQKIAASKAA
jgi:hypothetical protein